MLSPVTIITPSGGRPQAFALCKKYMERQVYCGEIQWIVVDDGAALEDPRLEFSRGTLTHILPEPKWKPGQNTLARNILAAIPEVQHDIIIVAENDDWMSPEYVSDQVIALETDSLVGEAPARYYHIPSHQYWELDNLRHASLCQTAMRRELLPLLKKICEEPSGVFIDVRLWAECRLPKQTRAGKTVVGMKGLPGRAGIGVGHRPQRMRGWKQDTPDNSVLRQWIGEDAELYSVF